MIRTLTRTSAAGLLVLSAVLGAVALSGGTGGANAQGNSEPRLGEPRAFERRVSWGRANPLRAEVKCPDGWRALSGGPSGERYAKSSLPMIQPPIENGSVGTIGWRVRFEYTGQRPSGHVSLFVICAPLG